MTCRKRLPDVARPRAVCHCNEKEIHPDEYTPTHGSDRQTHLDLILGAAQYATWRGLAAPAADAEDFSAVVMKELGRGNR